MTMKTKLGNFLGRNEKWDSKRNNHDYFLNNLAPYSLILCLLSLLLSCGNQSAPPVRTQNDIAIKNYASGIASLGLMMIGHIEAYLITETSANCEINSLKLMDGANIDGEGRFNLTLDIHKGLVLYVLKGATYREDASQRTVSMNQQQELRAIAYYDPAKTEITVTPWSHLQTGLFCWMLETGRWSARQAEKESAEFVLSMLGFDYRYKGVRLATDEGNDRLDVAFDDAVKLGFMNAALSQMSLDISTRLESIEHLTVNSIYMAQIFYEDIHNDGVLDGQSNNGPLFILNGDEVYQLSPATYRLELPRSLLNFYDNSPQHSLTTKGRGELYAVASRINTNDHPIVFNTPVPALDNEPPRVVWLSGDSLSGIVNLSLRIKDLTAIDLTRLSISGPNSQGSIIQVEDDIFIATIDTTSDGSGAAEYRVMVSDTLGNNRTYAFSVQLINEPPQLSIDALSHTRDSEYILSAGYRLVSEQQAIANGSCILAAIPYPAIIDEERNQVSCALTLTQLGDNHIDLSVCDTQGFCLKRQHRVVYDNELPEVRVLNEKSIYMRNFSLRFVALDRLSQVQEPIEWEIRGNGQRRHGHARSLGTDLYGIDTGLEPFGSGSIHLVIRARDSLNNIKEHRRSYSVANTPASADLTSDPWFKGNFYSLVFKVMENSFRNVAASCRIVGFTGFTVQAPTPDGIGKCDLLLPGAADGVYQVKIRLCGDYNLCVTETKTIIKDTTGPRITLGGLSANYTTNQVRIFISARDTHSNVTRLSYQLDGSPERFLTRINRSWLLSLDELSTGKHRLIVRAWDARDNMRHIGYDFVTIADEPSIRLVSAHHTAEDAYSLQVEVDSGSYKGDYKSWCNYSAGQVAGFIENNLLSCIIDLSRVEDGTLSIDLVLSPDYGKDYSYVLSLIKDTQAPRIDLGAVNAQYRGGAIPLILSIVDAHSAIQEAVYRLNDGEEQPLNQRGEGWGLVLPVDQLPTGRHSISIRTNDELGNEAIARKYFLVLKDEPSLVRTSAAATKKDSYTLVARIDSGTYPGDYEGNCQLDGVRIPASINGRALICSFDLSPLDDGEYAIYITLTPTDYDESYRFELSIIKDRGSPAISLNLASSYTQGGEQIAVMITDELSAIHSATYQIDQQPMQDLIKRETDYVFVLPASLVTGRHYVRLSAVDRLGNEHILRKYFLLLKDAPSITQTSPVATTSHAYTLTARLDPQSYLGAYTGLCQYGNRPITAIIMDNELSCDLVFSDGIEGEQPIRILLTADYGRNYRFDVGVLRDITPPEFDFAMLEAEYTGGAIPVEIGITDDYSILDNATATWRIAAYAAEETRYLVKNAGNQWSFTLPGDQLGTGQHTIEFAVADVLGNRRTASRSFLLLKDEPTLTQTSPPATNGHAYTLTARLDPQSYLGAYTGLCQYGNRPITAIIMDNELSCDLIFSDGIEGEQPIKILLTADYGRNYRFDVGVLRDITPPEFDFAMLEAEYTGGAIPVEIGITDDYSILDNATATWRIAAYAAGETQYLVKNAGNQWSFTLPGDQLGTGQHTIEFAVADVLGNRRTASRSFLLLKDEPTLTQTSPPATNGHAYTLTARLDPQSYLGAYTGLCQYGNRPITAIIMDNELSCDLVFSDGIKGEQPIRILLTADYGRNYRFDVGVLRDITPPEFDFVMLEAEYTGGAIPVEIGITDDYSILDNATATWRIAAYAAGETQYLVKNAGNQWSFTLPGDQLGTGQHTIEFAAADVLGNRRIASRSFLLLKDEPTLTQISPPATNGHAYTLTARLDPQSYLGAYTGLCQYGNRPITAIIMDNELSCDLVFSDGIEGEQPIRILLTADYGRNYRFDVEVLRDITPPEFDFVMLEAEYTGGAIPVEIGITDDYSILDNATATWRIAAYAAGETQYLVKNAGNQWSFTLPGDQLGTGQHTIEFAVADVLGNRRTASRSFLLLKDEPTLTQTSPPATNGHAYTLTARLDPQSYLGAYTGLCQYGNRPITAILMDNELSCDLVFSDGIEGEQPIRILLTADYGRNYRFDVGVLRDITPPEFDFAMLEAEYTGGAIPVEIGITDDYSILDNATATWRIAAYAAGETQYLVKNAGNQWSFTLPGDQLGTGQHTIEFAVADVLGNWRSMSQSFLLLKDEPSLVRISAAATNKDAHTFIARIEPGTYLGNYEGTCQLGIARISADINDRLLSCPLDLSQLNDGDYDMDISLTSDYGKTYGRATTITKDTKAPRITPRNLAAAYGREPFHIDFQLNEMGSLYYGYADRTQQLAAVFEQNSIAIHRVTVDPAHLAEGNNQLVFISSDALNNRQEFRQDIFVVKNPPQLAFAHPTLTNENPGSVYGNFSSIAEIGSEGIRCFSDNFYEPEGYIAALDRMDKRWHCGNIALDNGHLNELIEVEICDIYNNCRRFNTFLTYDDKPPIVVNDYKYLPPTISYLNLCRDIDYDDTSQNRNCVIVDKKDPMNRALVTDWYDIGNAEERRGGESPPPIVMRQQYTSMDYEDLANLSRLDAYDYVGVNVKDPSHNNYYSTTADKLNITYSYTQLNCSVDDANCVGSLRNVYFRNKPIPYKRISPNGEEVRVIIPFTNEFLNIENRSVWYLAPTSTIHKVELNICDELNNCLKLYTHFRVKIYAGEPVIMARTQASFLRILEQSDNYAMAMGSEARETRVWEINNPSTVDLWISAARVERINVEYLYYRYRKRNRYRQHRIREYEQSNYRPGDASCGRRPWPNNSRRKKYRIYHQYLTDDWQYAYQDTPAPHGRTFGTDGHSFWVRDSCSSPGANGNIIENRWETRYGYPKIVTEGGISRNTYYFTSLLNYYYIDENNARIIAEPNEGYYRIKPKKKLLIVSQDLFQGAPFLPSLRVASYALARKMDRYRDIRIPLGLTFTFAPSIYRGDDIIPDLSASQILDGYNPLPKKYRKYMGVPCFESVGAQICSDLSSGFHSR